MLILIWQCCGNAWWGIQSSVMTLISDHLVFAPTCCHFCSILWHLVNFSFLHCILVYAMLYMPFESNFLINSNIILFHNFWVNPPPNTHTLLSNSVQSVNKCVYLYIFISLYIGLLCIGQICAYSCVMSHDSQLHSSAATTTPSLTQPWGFSTQMHSKITM